MNKKFNRLLAFVLSVVMMIFVSPTSAFAAEDDGIVVINDARSYSSSPNATSSEVVESGTWGGIDWSLTEDGTLTIAPTKGEPTQLANKKTAFKVGEWPEAVRYDSRGEGAAIEGWPYNRAAVKKLVIEEGVTSIGSFAVQSFTNLTGEVVIPSTVTYIGQEAFQYSTMEKLTFAKGGTEALTIAQGALKNLIIEEIEFPADRPAINLKAWVLNNCDNLKKVTLPANVVSIGGTDAVDYYYFSTIHNAGNHSQLTFYNDKLDTIEFGSEEVKELFFTTWGNPITTIGVKDNYKTAATTASVGLTFCTSLAAAVEAAEPGDTITLLKDTDEVVELPAGVALENNGFTADNVVEAKKSAAKIGEQGFETLAEAMAEANKVAGDYTITLLEDCAEEFTFAQNAGVNITIDGNGKTFTGKITLNAGAGSLTFKNATLTPSNADAKSIVLNAATAPDITIDGCTLKNTGTKGAIVWGQASSTNNKVVIKNSTASYLQYLVGTNQAGCVDITVENVTATNMAYLIRPMKATKVTVKDVTYSGLTFIEVRVTSQPHTLALENVTVNTTQFPALLMNAPEAGDTPIPYIITINGDLAFSMNGVAATGTDWIMTQDAATCIYEIVNLNGLKGSGTEADPYQIGSVEDLIMFRDSVNAGETKYNNAYVILTADIDLDSVANWTPIGNVNYNSKYVLEATNVFSGVFDGNGKVIFNLAISKTVGGADTQANVGLFGITGAGAVIKNLTLTNVNINTDGRNVGALAGFAYNATLENITVNGDIQIKGGNNVAGVCGMTRNHALSATNISVSGNAGSAIVGNNIVGGIFAEIAPNGAAQTFTNLSVENIAITGVGGVGGIVGLLTNGTVDTVSVKNVVLTGRTDYQGDAMGRIRLGSVAGLMGGKYATITNATVENAIAKNLNGSEVILPIIGANYDASSNETEAKIGDKYYATFADAYKAAKDGETITLLAPIVVNAGETLTLDKNVTITYTSDVEGEDMITVRGTLNVAAGTITYINNSNGSNVTVSTISAEPGSVVNVTGGTIENKSVALSGSSSYAYAIDLLTNGSLGDVTVNIDGGTVYSNYVAIRQFNNGDACKNTLNVTGGNIYGAKRAIQIHFKNNAAHLTISGGVIEADGDYTLCFITTSENVSVTGGIVKGAVWYSGTEGFISGGTFDTALDEAYIVDGYKVVNDNGNYGVVVDPAYGKVAKIGDTYYTTLAEAISAAQDGETIVLICDIATSEIFTVSGKKITLDMNGKKITATDKMTEQNSKGNYQLFYVKGGELTVTGNGTIVLTAETNRAWNAMSTIFHNHGGVLTIENGTFTHNGGTDMAFVVNNSANYTGDAVANINGGTLTSTYIAIRNYMDKSDKSGKVTLNVSSGTIDGTSRAIWGQAASTSTTAPATGEINISGGKIGLIETSRSNGAVSMTTVTGGTVASFKGESSELTVKGGTLKSANITIYHEDGEVATYKVQKNGVYYAATAKIGHTYYVTLAEAVAAANKNTGNTIIYLTHDAEGAGFEVKATVQIMFQGYTYTINEAVEGTVGIKVSKGKLAMRGGSLKVAEGSGITTMIEAYADLSTPSMKMDGTNLEGETPVVIDTKGGITILTEAATTITVADGGWAIRLSGKGYASVHTDVTKDNGVKKSQIYAVANYSTKYYADLQMAIDAHPSATLLNSVELTDTIVIPAGKSFSLALNGKTISMTTAEYKSVIENKGTLVISGSGEIAMNFTGIPSTAAAVNTISNSGKLTVKGGTISNTGSGNQIGYAIDNFNGATLTVSGGTITASGSSYYDAIRLFCGSKSTTVTISGGKVSSIWAQNPSANKATEVKGTVTITGGVVDVVYFENYTTVKALTKLNVNVVAYGANSENTETTKSGSSTVYSFVN